MRFDDWMTVSNISNSAFGGRMGVSGETIRRYRAGEREPDQRVMAIIFDLTDGDVTPNDWCGVGPRSETTACPDGVPASALMSP